MSVSRRDVLKGMSLGAGSLVLAPALARLQAQAAGKPVTAKRFVFVVESNGVRPEQVVPVGLKRDARPQQAGRPASFLDVPLADKELPFSLAPIKPWQDRVAIVQGLSGRVCGGGKWKALRAPMFTGELELYDMSNDHGEKTNYALRRPDLAKHAVNLLNKHHQPDPNWKVPAAEKKPAR